MTNHPGISTLLVQALYVIPIVVAIISAPTRFAAQPGEEHRVAVSSQLSGVASGAWSRDGTTIYLVDVHKREILPFSLYGDYLEEGRVTATDLGVLNFSKLQRLSAGYILQAESRAGMRMLFLDDGLGTQSKPAVALVHADAASEYQESVGGIHAWTYSGSYFLAFSDIKQQIPPWVSGFVKIPKDSPEIFSYIVGLKLPIGDPMRNFYRIGLPYFASSGSKSYALIMENTPYLVEVTESGIRALKNLPPYCDTRPHLPNAKGVSGLFEVYRILETSEGPAGLYAWQGELFMLCRGLNNGILSWFLAKLDPSTGNANSLTHIETDAANLTVVPGSKYWAFIEKGTIQKYGDPPQLHMDVDSLLFVPSLKIADSLNNFETDSIGREVARGSGGALAWLNSNKEWMFSGIGLAVITGMIVILKKVWHRARHKTKKAKPKA